MRDESKLSETKTSVFERTNEHAKYMKHLISACRDTIVPSLKEVSTFKRSLMGAEDLRMKSDIPGKLVYACLESIRTTKSSTMAVKETIEELAR